MMSWRAGNQYEPVVRPFPHSERHLLDISLIFSFVSLVEISGKRKPHLVLFVQHRNQLTPILHQFWTPSVLFRMDQRAN